MATPKKGKRFIYSLEALLKVRDIRERQQQEKFNEAEKKLHEERLEESRIKKERDTHLKEVHAILSSDELPSLTTIQMHQQHIKKLEKDVKNQQEVVRGAENKREEELKSLIEKSKDKSIIKRDREKTRSAWKKMMDKLDSQFLDELSSIKFASKKIKDDEELLNQTKHMSD